MAVCANGGPGSVRRYTAGHASRPGPTLFTAAARPCAAVCAARRRTPAAAGGGRRHPRRSARPGLHRAQQLHCGGRAFRLERSAGGGGQVEPVRRPADHRDPHPLGQARQGRQRVAAGEEGQRTLQFFADRVEGNLLAAHQEIQKLGLLHPPGELSWAQVEAAVLNVARYDVFKLSEAVLGGQVLRVQRMLDGLEAEGEAAVLVHWALAEDIRALKRVKEAMNAGKPLPMALRENRVWGVKERLYERILPRLTDASADRLLQSAHVVDGIVKCLKVPDWPAGPWQALQRLAFQLGRVCAGAPRRS